MKTCPFCAEEIQDAAIVCKHCHRDLAPNPTARAAAPAAAPARKGGRGKWIALAAVVLVGWFLYYVASSSASVPIGEARNVVRMLESDKVVTDLNCKRHRATFSGAAWEQLTPKLRRNVMLALSRVCMTDAGDNDMDMTIYHNMTGRPIATFDGRSVSQ